MSRLPQDLNIVGTDSSDQDAGAAEAAGQDIVPQQTDADQDVVLEQNEAEHSEAEASDDEDHQFLESDEDQTEMLQEALKKLADPDSDGITLSDLTPEVEKEFLDFVKNCYPYLDTIIKFKLTDSRLSKEMISAIGRLLLDCHYLAQLELIDLKTSGKSQESDESEESDELAKSNSHYFVDMVHQVLSRKKLNTFIYGDNDNYFFTENNEHLLHGLSKSKTLQSISLTLVFETKKMIQYLSSVLKENKHLATLDLKRSRISPQGFVDFSHSLSNHGSSLKRLLLDSVSLCEEISPPTTSHSLSLEAGPVDPHDGAQVEAEIPGHEVMMQAFANALTQLNLISLLINFDLVSDNIPWNFSLLKSGLLAQTQLEILALKDHTFNEETKELHDIMEIVSQLPLRSLNLMGSLSNVGLDRLSAIINTLPKLNSLALGLNICCIQPPGYGIEIDAESAAEDKALAEFIRNNQKVTQLTIHFPQIAGFCSEEYMKQTLRALQTNKVIRDLKIIGYYAPSIARPVNILKTNTTLFNLEFQLSNGYVLDEARKTIDAFLLRNRSPYCMAFLMGLGPRAGKDSAVKMLANINSKPLLAEIFSFAGILDPEFDGNTLYRSSDAQPAKTPDPLLLQYSGMSSSASSCSSSSSGSGLSLSSQTSLQGTKRTRDAAELDKEPELSEPKGKKLKTKD